MTNNNRPPNPAADAYRKTASTVRNSPAFRDGLTAAAARVLELVAMLGDAGVFDLALDWPADRDDRVNALDIELTTAAARALSPEQIDNRQRTADQAESAAAAVLALDGPDDLARRTARLVKTMVRGIDVTDLPTPVLRELSKVTAALDAAATGVPDELTAQATEVVRVGRRNVGKLPVQLFAPLDRLGEILDRRSTAADGEVTE